MKITVTAESKNDSFSSLLLSVMKSLTSASKLYPSKASEPVEDFATGEIIGSIEISPPPTVENPILTPYSDEKRAAGAVPGYKPVKYPSFNQGA
jgi:hypothetical protein